MNAAGTKKETLKTTKRKKKSKHKASNTIKRYVLKLWQRNPAAYRLQKLRILQGEAIFDYQKRQCQKQVFLK